MSRISNIDWYRHLSFAAVGGFFAAYAILLRMGIMANAQTLNLLDILLNSFEGDWLGVLMHIGALVIYILWAPCPRCSCLAYSAGICGGSAQRWMRSAPLYWRFSRQKHLLYLLFTPFSLP